MKTRIKLLAIIGLLFFAGNSVMAQTFLYDRSGPFFTGGKDGVFFQADVEHGLVTLSSRSSRFTHAEQTVDGRRRRFDENIRDLEPDNWTRPLAERIVREAFSAAEISRIQQGDPLGIAMIICPQTGRVIEVNFNFHKRSGYATIPVATFRRIELALREQIRFTSTADGRRMNYIIRFWNQELVPAPRPERRNRLPPPPPIPIPQSPPPPSSPPPPPPPPHGPPGGGNNQPPQTEIGGEWRP